MLNFSIKNLLVSVSIACIACLVLTNPSLLMAKAMMLVVAISIVGLAVVGFWLRRPSAFVLVFLSIGYLVIADGGIFPSAERYLPSEWGLELCNDDGTIIFSGIKPSRPNSLTKWALAVDRNHNDWGYLYPVKPVTNTDKKALPESQSDTDETLDALLDLVESELSAPVVGPAGKSKDKRTCNSTGTYVQLPVLAFTKVSTVVSVGPRSSARNRPHFILGHCLIVILLLAVAITYFITMSKRTSRSTTEAKQPSRSQ